MIPMPNMKSAIVSAGLDRHHERRGANWIWTRDHRGHKAMSGDAAKVRMVKNRKYEVTYAPYDLPSAQ